MTEDQVWALVPTLRQAEALALLALARAEQTVPDVCEFGRATVDEVAAITGAKPESTGASLRALLKAGHVVKVAYLDVDKRGRDIARPGYRLAEGEA